MDLKEVVAVRKDKTIYKEGQNLVKVFDKNYSKSNILNEALNQSRIEETGLNIPVLQEVTKIDGKWAIVMDYVEGKTLEVLIKENPQKTDEYLELFVKTQIEVNNKKSKLLTVLNDKILRKLEDANLSNTTKFDISSRLAGIEKHDKVLHGDFQLSNVIVDKSNKVYVVDWSHATQGNASADAALSYILMILMNKKDLAEKYLELYSQKTNTDVKYIQLWMPIVAASQLNKYSGAEEKLLRTFIDVVDYQ
ncbi:MAG: phosphotransferase [Clostridia bacterium]|nr:phosphotransferase [Clostridia bacterium]